MIRQANLLRSIANPSLFPLNRCSNRMVSASVQNDVSLRQIRFGFAKKPVLKKLKAEAPKVQPKTQLDYIKGPESYKKSVHQIRNMQTVSQANLEQQSLRKIIITQRQYLQTSFQEESKAFEEGKDRDPVKDKNRILYQDRYKQWVNRYFLGRSLRYLQNYYINMFGLNLMGFTCLELMQNYEWIGWFYGLMTCPAATSSLALLCGYNFAFWVVRESFYLHVPSAKLKQIQISLISSNYRNIAELSFSALQFGVLMYAMFFPMIFPLYKVYVGLASLGFLSLGVNLRAVFSGSNVSQKQFMGLYVRLVSSATLLILLFSIYQIQFRAAETPETTYDSESYRKRLQGMRKGYASFKSSLKTKNYLMRQNQKINPDDD